MAGNGITGRDGDARISSTQICEITKWSFNPKINILQYASNKTAGYKQKLFGVRDATGTLEGVWDPAMPAYGQFTEGSEITLKLYINSTQFWQMTAVMEGFSMDTDIDNGEIVRWNAPFQTKGAWTAPVAALMLPEGMLPQMADPNQPVFVPAVPIQNEGESMEDALKRHSEIMKAMQIPVSLNQVDLEKFADKLVDLVSARLRARQETVPDLGQAG